MAEENRYRLDYLTPKVIVGCNHGKTSVEEWDRKSYEFTTSDEQAELKAKAFLYDESRKLSQVAKFSGLSRIEKTAQGERVTLIPLENVKY